MARVLMLSLVFSPDKVSTAKLMEELAHGLQARGHSITVLTSMPHYNPSVEVLQKPSCRKRYLFTDTKEGEIRVIRVYMAPKGRKIWRRVLDYLWFHLVTLIVAAFSIPPHDIVFVPSPPISLGVEGYLVSIMKRGKLIYQVQELWPDVPIRLGLIRNRILVKIVTAIEAFVYRQSVCVASIAESFIATLTKRGVPREKLRFTPNFIDVGRIRPLAKDNQFSREHGFVSKFVAYYGGNLGLTQGLDTLIEVSRILQQEREILLLVVGDGAEGARLKNIIATAGLENILLLPFEPEERVPYVYATADVCLSPMRRGFSYDTVPSKILTAMAAARPVISASEPDSDAAQLLTRAKAGIVVAPDSAIEMARAICLLSRDPELGRSMGRNGRNWILAHYSKDMIIDNYDRILRGMTRNDS